MTTTKPIQPATPLPWIAPGTDGGEYVICSDGSKGKRRTIAHAYEPRNAAYIVAACNAYPRVLAERAELRASLNNEIDQRERDSIIWKNSQYKEEEMRRLLGIAYRDLCILGYNKQSKDASDIRALLAKLDAQS